MTNVRHVLIDFPREFKMPVVVPISGEEVFKIHRPLSCQGCCCPCCMQAMQV